MSGVLVNNEEEALFNKERSSSRVIIASKLEEVASGRYRHALHTTKKHIKVKNKRNINQDSVLECATTTLRGQFARD